MLSNEMMVNWILWFSIFKFFVAYLVIGQTWPWCIKVSFVLTKFNTAFNFLYVYKKGKKMLILYIRIFAFDVCFLFGIINDCMLMREKITFVNIFLDMRDDHKYSNLYCVTKKLHCSPLFWSYIYNAFSFYVTEEETTHIKML